VHGLMRSAGLYCIEQAEKNAHYLDNLDSRQIWIL
jgi:hypothetical protein